MAGSTGQVQGAGLSAMPAMTSTLRCVVKPLPKLSLIDFELTVLQNASRIRSPLVTRSSLTSPLSRRLLYDTLRFRQLPSVYRSAGVGVIPSSHRAIRRSVVIRVTLDQLNLWQYHGVDHVDDTIVGYDIDRRDLRSIHGNAALSSDRQLVATSGLDRASRNVL